MVSDPSRCHYHPQQASLSSCATPGSSRMPAVHHCTRSPPPPSRPQARPQTPRTESDRGRAAAGAHVGRGAGRRPQEAAVRAARSGAPRGAAPPRRSRRQGRLGASGCASGTPGCVTESGRGARRLPRLLLPACRQPSPPLSGHVCRAPALPPALPPLDSFFPVFMALLLLLVFSLFYPPSSTPPLTIHTCTTRASSCHLFHVSVQESKTKEAAS